MCVNYAPLTLSRIAPLGLGLPDFEVPDEAYPGTLCPIILKKNGALKWQQAQFGLIPAWARKPQTNQATHNARIETIDQKPTFSEAWFKRQFALIPAESFYEPSYKTGKALRQRIHHCTDKPFLIAGLWDAWLDSATQQLIYSFTMLTINADQHPLMKQMHKPDDEKRTIVVIPFNERHNWLNATPEQAKQMLYQYQGLPVDVFTATDAPREELSTQGILFE